MKKLLVTVILAMVLLVSTFAIADVGLIGPPIDIDDIWQIERTEYTVLVTDVPIETHLLQKMEWGKWAFITVVKHEGNFHWYFSRPMRTRSWNQVEPPYKEEALLLPVPVPTFNLQ